mmetsp:Transcript_24682/g.34442  ORF Transcript_24682/g.34442 Transcript_24682/m.34442 type:complete len:224 (-) Transcript_24682:359-1030(-)
MSSKRGTQNSCPQSRRRRRRAERGTSILCCEFCNDLRRELKHCTSKELKRTLEIEYWKRSEDCSRRKKEHMQKIEGKGGVSMEDWVMQTTLKDTDHAMERNPFPYQTPKGIEHWTLWALHEMDRREIERYVYDYTRKNMPNVVEWEYDENSHRSIHIFHVHVYLKFKDQGSFQAEFETPPREESVSEGSSKRFRKRRREKKRSGNSPEEDHILKERLFKRKKK